MKNIGVLVNTFLRPSEGFIFEQIRHVRTFNVEVLTREYRNPQLFPWATVNAIYREKDPARFREALGYTLLRRSPFLERVVSEKNIELLHAHFGTDGVYALPLKRKAGIPLFVTFHGHDITRLPKMTVYPPAWMNYWFYFRELRREGDVFLAVSEFIKKKLLEKGFPGEKVKVHYLGIDTNRAPGRKKREKIILFAARLVEKKGAEYLIRAMPEMIKADPEIQLWIVGNGPLRHKLEALTSDLGLRGKVVFHGWKRQEELFGMMEQASVFVLPSIEARDGDCEGLGMVVLEAMLHELPVVGTQHGGIPEMVIENRTGYLAPEKDGNALAEKLRLIFDNPAQARLLGKQAREFVRENFDIRRQIDKLERMYSEWC